MTADMALYHLSISFHVRAGKGQAKCLEAQMWDVRLPE